MTEHAYEELGERITRFVGEGDMKMRRHDALGLTCAVASRLTQPQQHIYEPTFALVVSGEKQLVLGDRTFRATRGTFMIISVDLPMSFRFTKATAEEPYIALSMKIRPSSVASLLLDAPPLPPVSAPEGPALGLSKAGDELVDAMLRLIRLLDAPRDIPVLGPLAEREILWRLFHSEQGARVRQIGRVDSHCSQIGRTIRHIRENYARTLRIEDLAQIAAMSVTSFHRHFRAVALMSPVQYQKQIRLQEARARLLATADDMAAIGHAVGYESPSQFSREYRRAFGAPPGEDARQLRALQAK